MTVEDKVEVPEVAPKRAARWKANPPARNGGAGGGGAFYGLGMIGALVYFLAKAEAGSDYLLAFPKAMVWPALLVYKLLRSLEG